MTTPTLLIHHYPDGGANFAWTKDASAIDPDFWQVADEDQTQIYIICEMIRKPECREAAFQFALTQCNPVEAMKFIRLIEEIESGRCTLPAGDLLPSD